MGLRLARTGRVYCPPVELDLVGKVRNTTLPASKPLLPLFDAIVNSIDAIEDRRRTDGRITVRIERDRTQTLLKDVDHTPHPVCGFVVEDNGTGFDAENFRSFNTSDSSWKKDRGGKGIGRFLWLKAFGRVRIESWFLEGGHLKHRSFEFAEPIGVSNHGIEPADGRDTGSIVRLERMIPQVSDECPRTRDVIATRITDHCAGFFLRADCPRIDLLDDDQAGLSLNDWFREQGYVAEESSFNVASRDLKITHLHVRDAQAKHRIYFCANDREVKWEPINILDLPRRLQDESGSYVLASRVSGAVLDENTNQERTGFTLPQDEAEKDLYSPGVTFGAIYQAAVGEVRSHVAQHLEAARLRKMEQFEEYVETEAPEYRPLLKHYREELATIPADLPPEKLDRELHAAKYRVEAATREAASRLLSEEQISPEDYSKELDGLLVDLNDFGKADLVKYVAHRRVVLNLFRKALGLQVTAKYSLESQVHKIIFPLQKTSDDVEPSQQNLWIIDERLTYHRYLASDKALSDIPGLDGPERPDLLIFDRPFAFSENGTTSAVVIIEFKRPMRDGYTADENPIHQVCRYVERIQASRAEDPSGRLIPITSSTPFYAYVLADLTEPLIRQAKFGGLNPTPDGRGFYGFIPALRTYIELISYDKMLDDATKRNRAFFERLGLPGQ